MGSGGGYRERCLTRFEAKERESIMAFDCGGVGSGALWAAMILGSPPIHALDLAENRLDLAKELGGT